MQFKTNVNYKRRYLSRDDTLVREMELRAGQLKSYIKYLESLVEKAPGGHLRAIKNHDTWQYYLVETAENRNGSYIRKRDRDIAAVIAQRDFDNQLLKELQKQLIALQASLSGYKPDKLCDYFEKLSPARKLLVKPAFQPYTELAAKWQAVKFKSKLIPEGAVAFKTSRGEKVRSKSELIIADTLAWNKIPYRYEYPLILKNIKKHNFIIHPDFYCLNVRTGKEFVWEHFGLIGNAGYSENVVLKLNDYILNGWLPGKNLITTFESSEYSLNQQVVDELIKNYLK